MLLHVLTLITSVHVRLLLHIRLLLHSNVVGVVGGSLLLLLLLLLLKTGHLLGLLRLLSLLLLLLDLLLLLLGLLLLLLHSGHLLLPPSIHPVRTNRHVGRPLSPHHRIATPTIVVILWPIHHHVVTTATAVASHVVHTCRHNRKNKILEQNILNDIIVKQQEEAD